MCDLSTSAFYENVNCSAFHPPLTHPCCFLFHKPLCSSPGYHSTDMLTDPGTCNSTNNVWTLFNGGPLIISFFSGLHFGSVYQKIYKNNNNVMKFNRSTSIMSLYGKVSQWNNFWQEFNFSEQLRIC